MKSKKPPDPSKLYHRRIMNRISADASRTKRQEMMQQLCSRNIQLEVENSILRRKLQELTAASACDVAEKSFISNAVKDINDFKLEGNGIEILVSTAPMKRLAYHHSF
ncbi:hypothetical protein MDAP_001527 [Mitosporidium daphniae]|uniref:BZIP domain-containing protein n=1 Tax=Mitosporidium daphniae TaxID=1485682 RepID=A0A098VQP0_9MICR|nr:uncharacterized protein DI09_90p40 [Mitosporidium daphniae]KGG50051.1 hypothetical protein DI09_90p40 [Mitosporidium daphniae]|eukprot:XP_013236492.1 uncharacterized protein DI09_90p40 [Mitosporidium daphniae]